GPALLYPLSLHDALPISASHGCIRVPREMAETFFDNAPVGTPVIVKEEAVMHTVSVPPLPPPPSPVATPAPNLVRSAPPAPVRPDRKSTRLNSSHVEISY